MKKGILLFISILVCGITFGQNFTISGNIKDGSNGEDLIGATVRVKEMPGTGAVANTYGFYSLTLEKGNYTIIFQMMGFQNIEKEINLDKNITFNIELKDEASMLDEVVVSTEKEDGNVSDTRMSVTKISPKDIEAVPVLFGEKDIVKTLQLMPGIKAAGEGNSGFFVRGGGADQNLILLDEAPVYNASHLLGFFSVFNSDAVKDVTLYKGGIPAEYGGRASSVMDIIMKDGNSKKFGGSGGIGLISSKLTLEGPIIKNKSSFIISGRRTYADIFLKLSSEEQLKNTTLFFYDLNLKSNYRINDKNRIFLSGYFGRDKFNFSQDFGFNWGNATGTVRWNHIFSEKLFSNTSVIISNYDYKVEIAAGDGNFGILSGIKDWNIQQDFSYYMNSKNTIKFGLIGIYHRFIPGKIEVDGQTNVNSSEIENRLALEGGAYIQNEHKVSSVISLNYGLRYSHFANIGPGPSYSFDAEGNLTEEINHNSGEIFANQGGFEPRLSVKYQLNEKSSVKLGLNRNYQYLHLLSNATTSTPFDVWVPSTNNVKPQIANQIAGGYFRNLKNNEYEISAEVYYKTLENQIEYKNGADLFLNPTVESELVFGKGKSYGLEMLVRKRKGKLTGWISYTLSRTFRIFEDINKGDEFPARQDRIHDLAIVGMYKINEKITLSANWVFYTGDAVTAPSGKYTIDGITLPYYTERNGFRMPDYHRMDIGITIQGKKTEKFESNWNFSVYNLYGRENPYVINFRESESGDPDQLEAVQLSLFKIIPSFSYNFKF